MFVSRRKSNYISLLTGHASNFVRVVALYEYAAQGPEEVSLAQGDLLVVLEKVDEVRLLGFRRFTLVVLTLLGFNLDSPSVVVVWKAQKWNGWSVSCYLCQRTAFIVTLNDLRASFEEDFCFQKDIRLLRIV